MINRESLLRAIGKAMDEPQEGETRAESALRVIGIQVILPLIEALQFDARPMFREKMLTETRDLLMVPPLRSKPQADDPDRISIPEE